MKYWMILYFILFVAITCAPIGILAIFWGAIVAANHVAEKYMFPLIMKTFDYYDEISNEVEKLNKTPE